MYNSFRQGNLIVSDLKAGLYVLQVLDKSTGDRKSEKIMIVK